MISLIRRRLPRLSRGAAGVIIALAIALGGLVPGAAAQASNHSPAKPAIPAAGQVVKSSTPAAVHPDGSIPGAKSGCTTQPGFKLKLYSSWLTNGPGVSGDELTLYAITLTRYGKKTTSTGTQWRQVDRVWAWVKNSGGHWVAVANPQTVRHGRHKSWVSLYFQVRHWTRRGHGEVKVEFELINQGGYCTAWSKSP